MGVLEQAALRQAQGQTFVLATVVRGVSVIAAKAAAKALIGPDGSIEEGWIGGGCASAAVVKAARQCMADGQSRLVSIAPKDALAELGAAAGEERGGVFYAKNSCPSEGTMDVFVEPVLPSPRLLILGASPVAVALARLAPSVGFAVTVARGARGTSAFRPQCLTLRGFIASQRSRR
jgi:xanthine dehydrogenase accessory factor